MKRNATMLNSVVQNNFGGSSSVRWDDGCSSIPVVRRRSCCGSSTDCIRTSYCCNNSYNNKSNTTTFVLYCVVVAIFVIMSRSEAFATTTTSHHQHTTSTTTTTSRPLVFGISASLVHTIRGGDSSSSSRRSRSDSNNDDDNSHSSSMLNANLNGFKCIMQELPPIKNGYIKNGYNTNGSSSNSNGSSITNGNGSSTSNGDSSNKNSDESWSKQNGFTKTSTAVEQMQQLYQKKKNGRAKYRFATPRLSSSSSSRNMFSSNSNNNDSSNSNVNINDSTHNNSNKNNQITPVEFVAETKLPTDLGQFQLRAYRVPGTPPGYGQNEPCVIYYRDKPPFTQQQQQQSTMIPVRIHDQCLTSEVFGSRRCDCKEQLNMALQYIKEHGGIIIYLQQEGRGIGLANKIHAYSLQDNGMDTVDANIHLGFPDDARTYNVVPSILHDMNIDTTKIQLMTNNPRKIQMMKQLGITIQDVIPMVIPQTNPYNHKYMETKAVRMDHTNMSPLFEDGGVVVSNLPPTNNKYDGNVMNENNNYIDPSLLVNNNINDNNSNGRIANGMMAPRRGGGTTTTSSSTSVDDINNVNYKVSTEVSLDGLEQPTDNVSSSSNNNGYSVPSIVQTNEDHTTNNNYDSDDDDDEMMIGIQARTEDGYCLGKESVIHAIDAMERGEIIVVVDDLDRENEGDFIMAADKCTPQTMATIIKYSSGVVCIGMEQQRLEQLQLPPMTTNNQDPKGTAFTISVDATKEHGITTGISAHDRSITIQLLSNPNSTANDFHRPGHIFPLRAVPGGVLQRNGHTEASVDFAKLANCQPMGVLCELVSQENPIEMMKLPEIKRFCKHHGFVLTSIADLIQYRKEIEQQEQQQQQQGS